MYKYLHGIKNNNTIIATRYTIVYNNCIYTYGRFTGGGGEGGGEHTLKKKMFQEPTKMFIFIFCLVIVFWYHGTYSSLDICFNFSKEKNSYKNN